MKSKHNIVKILPRQSFHNFEPSSPNKNRPALMKSEMLIQNSKNKIVEKEEKDEQEDDLYDDSKSVAAIKSR